MYSDGSLEDSDDSNLQKVIMTPRATDHLSLTITIKSCSDLLAWDINGLSDAYVKAVLDSIEIHKREHILKI